jgi:hypothetical protein
MVSLNLSSYCAVLENKKNTYRGFIVVGECVFKQILKASFYPEHSDVKNLKAVFGPPQCVTHPQSTILYKEVYGSYLPSL